FIAMTEQKTVEKAIEATKQGAFGYITKPFDSEQLLSLVERTQREVARRRDLARQQDRRARALRTRVVGQSVALERMFDLVERVAATRATVLVIGETGTGKELVAQGIHELSDRFAGPFVP